jgi:hypothetical protein
VANTLPHTERKKFHSRFVEESIEVAAFMAIIICCRLGFSIQSCEETNSLLPIWNVMNLLSGNKIAAFRHMTPCYLTEKYPHFGGMHCLHLQDGNTSPMNMGVAVLSKRLYLSIRRRHISDDRNHNIYR